MKLSFIVPVYNVAPYLRKCVESLLAQDYEDYEIILVDDGSTDNSEVICDEYASPLFVHSLTRSVVIKVIHQANGGLSAARNSGIKIANGEYICFVDSDDYWQPNVLSELMAQIERDNLDVLRFRLQYVRIVESGESRVKSQEHIYEIYNPYKSDSFKGNDYSEEPIDGVSFLNSRMNTQCYAWQFILRRNLIVPDDFANSITPSFANSLTLFTEGIYFEDTDWTPRMLAKAKRVASTNTVVYNYLVREGSITNAVNRDKRQKVLEDLMRLIGEMQNQERILHQDGYESGWFSRMISDTVIHVIGFLSSDFYEERRLYLERLQKMAVYPILSTTLKARLINFSPRLAVELAHLKYRKLQK